MDFKIPSIVVGIAYTWLVSLKALVVGTFLFWYKKNEDVKNKLLFILYPPFHIYKILKIK